MKQTAVEWLYNKFSTCTSDELVGNINNWFEQAKAMEKEQQIELLKFNREMCTPDAPVDYIIKEYRDEANWKN